MCGVCGACAQVFALNGVSLTFARDEITCILGPNGAGALRVCV
jgi:ABC-type multidrug transport system ATPase subunit